MKPLAHETRSSVPPAELNMIPFLDILLVLLVVFMATTPAITQSVQIKLPTVAQQTLPSTEWSDFPIIVEVGQQTCTLIDGEERLMLNSIEDLVAEVAAWKALAPNRAILLAGDASVVYQRITSVLSALKEVGIEEIGLMFQSEQQA